MKPEPISTCDSFSPTARRQPCRMDGKSDAPAVAQLMELSAKRVYSTSPALSRVIVKFSETEGCYAKIFLAGMAILAIGLLINLVSAVSCTPMIHSSMLIVAIYTIGFDLIKNGGTETLPHPQTSGGKQVIFYRNFSVASTGAEPKESTASYISVDLDSVPYSRSMEIGQTDAHQVPGQELDHSRSCSEILPDPEVDEGA